MDAASMPQVVQAASARERVAVVAFCTDSFMEAPLHVAASSLLRNLHPDYTARFYFLLRGFPAKNIRFLRRTLDGTGRTYTANFLETSDGNMFRNFRPLHGNYTPYYRLLLPDLVQEDRLLYFDSDTQVALDVSPLFEVDMQSKAMGFVVDGILSMALESEFYLSLGKPPEGPSFNSGAMLFNLPEWRRQDCSARIFSFCQDHSAHLMSADQTVLNALFSDDCFHIDPVYNIKVYGTSDPAKIPSKGVFHFLGSPKPWDIGGRHLLPRAESWFVDLQKTAVPFHKRISLLNRAAWSRLPKILGGYRRIARKKLFAPKPISAHQG